MIASKDMQVPLEVPDVGAVLDCAKTSAVRYTLPFLPRDKARPQGIVQGSKTQHLELDYIALELHLAMDSKSPLSRYIRACEAFLQGRYQASSFDVRLRMAILYQEGHWKGEAPASAPLALLSEASAGAPVALLAWLDPVHRTLLPADFHAHGGKSAMSKFVDHRRVITTQKEFLFVVSANDSKAQVRVQGSDTTWTIQLPQVGFWAMDGRGDGRMALQNGAVLEHGRPREQSTRLTVRFVVFSKDGEPDNDWAEDVLAAADRAAKPTLSNRPVPPSIQRLIDAGLRPAQDVPRGWLGKRPSSTVIGSHRAGEHKQGLGDLHAELRGLLAKIQRDKGEEERTPNTFGACGWALTYAHWADRVLEELGEHSPFFQPLARGIQDALEYNEAFLLRQRANARVLGTRGSMKVVNGAAGLRLVAMLHALDPTSLDDTLGKIVRLKVVRTGYLRPSIDTGIAVQLDGNKVATVVHEVMRNKHFRNVAVQAKAAYAPDLEDQCGEDVAAVYRLAAELIQSYKEGAKRDRIAYGLTAFERYHSRLRGVAAATAAAVGLGAAAGAVTRQGIADEVNAHLPQDKHMSIADILGCGDKVPLIRLQLEQALIERDADPDSVVRLADRLRARAADNRKAGGLATQASNRAGQVNTAYMTRKEKELAREQPLQAVLDAHQHSECRPIPRLALTAAKDPLPLHADRRHRRGKVRLQLERDGATYPMTHPATVNINVKDGKEILHLTGEWISSWEEEITKATGSVFRFPFGFRNLDDKKAKEKEGDEKEGEGKADKEKKKKKTGEEAPPEEVRRLLRETGRLQRDIRPSADGRTYTFVDKSNMGGKRNKLMTPADVNAAVDGVKIIAVEEEDKEEEKKDSPAKRQKKK